MYSIINLDTNLLERHQPIAVKGPQVSVLVTQNMQFVAFLILYAVSTTQSLNHFKANSINSPLHSPVPVTTYFVKFLVAPQKNKSGQDQSEQ